jgi:hypothetical protein
MLLLEAAAMQTPSASLILAGDFNSLPGSNVVNFMQGLPPKASCSNEIESLWRDDLPALKSVYAQYDNDKHPEFTNFVSDFSLWTTSSTAPTSPPSA